MFKLNALFTPMTAEEIEALISGQKVSDQKVIDKSKKKEN